MSLDFRRYCYLIIPCMTAFIFSNAPSSAADPADEWQTLWKRCFDAIETARPMDSQGLENLGFSYYFVPPNIIGEAPVGPFLGSYIPEQRWALPHGRFVVVETESPPINGKSRSSCNLERSDEGDPITSEEATSLAAAFRLVREHLLTTGRYEIRDPDPIFPIALGVQPSALSPNDCRIISDLFVAPNNFASSYFSTLTGEQNGSCGALPRFQHLGRSNFLNKTIGAAIEALNDSNEVNPIAATITGCLQKSMIICQFAAYSGAVLGQIQTNETYSGVRSIELQSMKKPEDSGAFYAVLARWLELATREADAQVRSTAMSQGMKEMATGKQSLQLSVGDVMLFISRQSDGGLAAGMTRR